MPASQPFILIVEDNALIAMELEFLVEQCGCAVVGPVGNVSGALSLIHAQQIEGAVLDINLGADRVWPVADLLSERGVPFLFATGHEETILPDRFKNRPVLKKPVTLSRLAQTFTDVGVTGA